MMKSTLCGALAGDKTATAKDQSVACHISVHDRRGSFIGIFSSIFGAKAAYYRAGPLAFLVDGLKWGLDAA